MDVETMKAQALNHKHEPTGGVRWEYIDNSSKQFAPCKCGIVLSRETAPQGARYNWEDWKVSA